MTAFFLRFYQIHIQIIKNTASFLNRIFVIKLFLGGRSYQRIELFMIFLVSN